MAYFKGAYPVQRAPALCGVWGRVLVASLTLACAMRGDRDSNPGPSDHRRKPSTNEGNYSLQCVVPETKFADM